MDDPVERFTARHPDVDPADCSCSYERGAKCRACQDAALVELTRLEERHRRIVAGWIDPWRCRLQGFAAGVMFTVALRAVTS